MVINVTCFKEFASNGNPLVLIFSLYLKSNIEILREHLSLRMHGCWSLISEMWSMKVDLGDPMKICESRLKK